jgi:hypothetical protein
MKKFAGILLILVGVCGAAAYWIDLTEFTDPTKGFSTVGSIWLRYALLALLLGIVAVASLMTVQRPAAMERKNLPLAVLCAVCGIACVAVGALELLSCIIGAFSFSCLVLGVGGIFCGWWTLALCGHWGSAHSGTPAGGVAFGILGSFFFLVLTLVRFAGNYSSLYRFAQTMQTFSALAALMLSAVLLRVSFFPESRWGRREYTAGMWAFYLCTCCEVPQAVFRFMEGQTAVSELAISMLLGCMGLLGAGCALSALSGERQKAANE